MPIIVPAMSQLHFVRYYLLSVLLLLPLAALGFGYDTDADPATTYQQALQRSAEEGKLVLVVFGSEWCPDCRSLNKKIMQAPLAATVEASFVVAHIDIGNWDRNMAFTEKFGNPVEQGIPSIAIVASDGRILYVSEAGEFASARSAELTVLNDWFADMLAQTGEQ